jgi:hypothetical protein
VGGVGTAGATDSAYEMGEVEGDMGWADPADYGYEAAYRDEYGDLATMGMDPGYVEE